ncbi:response regulator [Paracoccus sediminicola]|uniref:response regulator n=1 Tax=Paracoccus sediminicola TaxID=3017783 RepID=UPI0022F0E4F7|nr:response regulator [Paracoccus sediminicola]WBU56504.1 response regulator [Paracoccus sediminicola]
MDKPRVIGARRVMICTADTALTERIGKALSGRGFTATSAADADSVLFQLNVAPPDAMLCDQSLPGHEGMALTQMIRRERPDLADMPIIVMSDFGEPADIVAGKMAGADDYLAKPLDTELLAASLESQLRLVSRLRAMQAAATIPTRGAPQLSAFHALLDRLAFGVVLYDLHGQPIFMNLIARQLSRANVAKIRVWVSRLAAQSVREPMLPDEHVLDFRMIPVGASRGNSAQHLFVATLDLSESKDATTIFAATIFASSHVGLLGSELVSDAIGLTPTESRLAGHLAEGLRLDQIGETMGIAKPTVNYHLRNIYQKSGASRQPELINMLRAVHLVGPASGETTSRA